MNTCKTCQHWQPKRSGTRADADAVGECHAGSPLTHFTWPRTKDQDYCSLHTAHPTQAQQQAAFATALERNGYKPGQIVPLAPGQPFILDAGTPGDAPPAAAGNADGGPGNRRRVRAKA